MSTRIPIPPVPSASQKKKHNATHKRMPTDEKDVKLKTRLMEQQNKNAAALKGSIANRMQFLQNTKVSNMRNEKDRLTNTLVNGPMAYANDGRYTPINLSTGERVKLTARREVLQDNIKNIQPIIGAQGRYLFSSN